MTNSALLPIGTITETMLHGHVATIEITKHLDEDFNDYEATFVCHTDSGQETLCLDLGQNWFISKGETVKTSTRHIETAAAHAKEINTCIINRADNI